MNQRDSDGANRHSADNTDRGGQDAYFETGKEENPYEHSEDQVVHQEGAGFTENARPYGEDREW